MVDCRKNVIFEDAIFVITISVLAMYLREDLVPSYRDVFGSQNLFEGILGHNG